MNCSKAQRWLSQELDGELAPGRLLRLHAHVAGCEQCQAAAAAWRTLGADLRAAMPAAPAPAAAEQAWLDVRRRIRHAAPPRRWAWLLESPVWTPLRTALALGMLLLAVGLGVRSWLAAPIAPSQALARGPSTVVESVESGLADAAPMVYQDAQSDTTVIWVVEAVKASKS